MKQLSRKKPFFKKKRQRECIDPKSQALYGTTGIISQIYRDRTIPAIPRRHPRKGLLIELGVSSNSVLDPQTGITEKLSSLTEEG